jgi:hypothetical protein
MATLTPRKGHRVPRSRKDGPGVAVAVVPIVITQVNCTAALGMNERRYLEWIIERGVPCKKEGKLRVVEASTALRFLAPVVDSAAGKVDTDAISPDDEVDLVLAAVGRRRVR